MNKQNQKLLLKLARKTIENNFRHKDYDLENVLAEFREKKGVFVTLQKDGRLRGCVGSIEPVKSIYDGVKENALNAAFRDPRFSKLTEGELKTVYLEISVLTPPKKLEYHSPEDLLGKLTGKEGVILERNHHRATFLPQVWEDLPGKEEFLEYLSIKAGLAAEAWKQTKIYVYFAEVFREE
ncbi:MAG TPA: AmmeMemoRadiSam system protein A [Candidatus Nanoarchaeia archaeon]|nr:AmmeMemoRadiSam system protein A [Candidatus Nanoarchaeia archaeon]